jgi:hypothetical protein
MSPSQPCQLQVQRAGWTQSRPEKWRLEHSQVIVLTLCISDFVFAIMDINCRSTPFMSFRLIYPGLTKA